MIFLFGLDETGKKLKKALAVAGADMQQVRPWLKSYMFVRKNVRPVAEHYHRTQNAAEQIGEEARELEAMLSSGEELTDPQKKRIHEIAGKLKVQKENLDFEFVIGRDDSDVHLTLDSVSRLSEEYLQGKADPIILQSEVENLTALIKDRLNKEKPDLFLLAVFYRNHTDQELQDKSHSGRLIFVNDIFHEEFAGPILPILKEARDKAAEWLEDSRKNPQNYQTGKKKKLLERTAILLTDASAGKQNGSEDESGNESENESENELLETIRNREPEEMFLRHLCTM